MDFMPFFPDESIDMILTDPPYNVGKDYGEYKDDLSEEEYWIWYEEVFKEIYRIHKNGYLYVSCSSRQIFQVKPILESIGYDYLQYIIWYRPNMTGGTKIITLPWSLMHEPILCFKKGKRLDMLNEVRGYLTHDVMTYTAPQRNYRFNKRHHITQKPLKLYQHLIARTPGNIIFDPFLGSGTTLKASLNMNRIGLGIEIDKVYEDIINSQISSTTLTNFE